MFSCFATARGTALLPSGIAGVLGASPALFTCIASAVFLRHERMNRLMCSGVLLGIVGIALISRPWSGNGTEGALSSLGVCWMLMGSLVFGLSYIYIRRYLSAIKLSPLAIVTWQMGLALLMLVCLTDLHGIGRIMFDWKAVTGLVFGLGLLGTGASLTEKIRWPHHLKNITPPSPTSPDFSACPHRSRARTPCDKQAAATAPRAESATTARNAPAF